MTNNTFTIVFEKLAEATAEQATEASSLQPQAALSAEIHEIAELRRLVLEITDPEPLSYTTT